MHTNPQLMHNGTVVVLKPTFLLLLLLQALVGYCQTNTEYNFVQMRAADDTRFNGTAENNVFVTNMTLDCFAANGYGQWTASSNTGAEPASGPGWYLLGNGLYEPGIWQPSGSVDGAPFIGLYPTEPKVTANLHGSVRYVWPSDNRTTFIVQGHNDDPTLPLAQKQIDITLEGLPNPSFNRRIFTSGIFAYNPVGTANHAPISTALEPDFRDIFDVVSDKKFLYIVWCSNTNSTIPGTKEVWVTAVDIHTMIPATGYPLSVSLGKGERPTVSCDSRNNPNDPTFDVGYIENIATGSAVWKSYVGNIPVTTEILQKNFVHPTLGGSVPYSAAHHVRVLTSSIFTPTGLLAPVRAMYVITHDDHLILYRPLTGNPAVDIGTYVDGNLTMAYPLPIPPPAQGTGYPVLDRHLIAFANPYDNQSGIYNQFHCLYQLQLAPGGQRPLLIVRGFDNAFPFAGGAPNDTRLVLNQFSGALQLDPDKYVGAVNQMGIHVRWRTANIHFYSRDVRRSFDEFIDENTLVTNECKIKDGTFHGGLAGAQVFTGKRMTVWTDPNNGTQENNLFMGLYLRLGGIPAWNLTGSYNGALYFVGDDVTLSIGGPTRDEAAFFSTMPSAVTRHFLTDEPAYTGGFENQSILVGPASIWEYYGLLPVDLTSMATIGDNVGSTLGGQNCAQVTVKLQGGPGAVQGSIAHASLRIHGGAYFNMRAGVEFFSDKGSIECLFEPHIAPILMVDMVNDPALGKIKLGCFAQWTDSKIISHVPANQDIRFALITDDLCGDYNMSRTFSALNCTFENVNASGFGKFLFQPFTIDSEKGYDQITIDGCAFSGIRLEAFNPQKKIIVEDSDFDRLFGNVINIERTATFLSAHNLPYDDVHILRSDFNDKASTTLTGPVSGVSITNFSTTGSEGKVIVDNCDFISSNNAPGSLEVAIKFLNATGEVTNNDITDPGYIRGIKNTGVNVNGITPFSRTFFCNNDIWGIVGSATDDGIGMELSHYIGYIKLSTIKECEFGVSSGVNGHPFPTFSIVQDCEKEGLRTTHLTSVMDLSGVHGATSSGDDYAAFNTIRRNGQSYTTPVQIVLESGSKVELGNNLQTWTWTQFAENNIVRATGGPLLIRGATTTSSSALGNIDRNHWGTGIDPALGGGVSPGNWSSSQPTDVHCENVTYTALTANTRTVPTSPGFSVSCSFGFPMAKEGQQPQSLLSTDSCQLLYNLANSYAINEMPQACYDTARKFIETCPYHPESFRAFQFTDYGVQSSNVTDTSRFRRYRDWLVSVLFLNTTDQKYFCADMYSIAGTYAYSEAQRLPNASLSIYRWMDSMKFCPEFHWDELYQNDIEYRYDQWLLGDTTKPFDTTLHTLEELGLGFLDTLSADVSSIGQPSERYLGEARLSQNPFTHQTMLHYELLRNGYIALEVFDVLGHSIWQQKGDGLMQGKYAIPIELTDYPSGSYFLRIESGFGEVLTLKLIKE